MGGLLFLANCFLFKGFFGELFCDFDELFEEFFPLLFLLNARFVGAGGFCAVEMSVFAAAAAIPFFCHHGLKLQKIKKSNQFLYNKIN